MNTDLLWIFGSSFIIMLASLSGIFFIGKIVGDWMHKYIGYFISFSAGVFLIIAINLAKESLHMQSSVYIAIACMATGVLLATFLSKILPEQHRHEDSECCKKHDSLLAIKMMIGDSVHNIADGFLLVPAFLVNIELGILTALGIFIHEFVQEVSEFFVYKEAGFGLKKILVWNFLSSMTILIGVVLGMITSQSEAIIGAMLGIASGIFIYTVVADLIPRSRKKAKSKKILFIYIALAILGSILIASVNSLSGHEEIHDAIHSSEVNY